MLVGWTKCFVVNGSLTYKRCPPTTPLCQPSRILPPGYNRSLILPGWTEVHASTGTDINHTQAKPTQTLRPKQHLLHLRPHLPIKMPKPRCETPCRKPKEAPREGRKSTAMPFAVQGAPSHFYFQQQHARRGLPSAKCSKKPGYFTQAK